MKYISILLSASLITFLFTGCSKESDSNELTAAAVESLNRIVGDYEIVSMTWNGPSVDVDNDGLADCEFTEKHIFQFGSENFAQVSGPMTLDERGRISYGYPVSQLDEESREFFNIPGYQLIMYRKYDGFSVSGAGDISVELDDYEFHGQYLKNLRFEWIDDGFIITADSHLWDFITSSEVKGKTIVEYRKKN